MDHVWKGGGVWGGTDCPIAGNLAIWDDHLDQSSAFGHVLLSSGCSTTHYAACEVRPELGPCKAICPPQSSGGGE